MSRWRRLLCRMRGHQPLLVIDKARLIESGPNPYGGGWNLGFQATKTHRTCQRCKGDL